MAGPVPPVTLPTVYTAIYEMVNHADPTIKFRNTYDFHSPTIPTPADPLFAALTGLQSSMTWDDCDMIEVRVYPWSRGPNTYPSGLPIFTIPVNAPGAAQIAWAITTTDVANGGEVCLRIDRAHNGIGKPGRLFYRTIPRASDVQAVSGGRWSIVSGSHFDSAHFDSIKTNTGIKTYLVGGGSTNSFLAMVQYSPKHKVVNGYELLTDFVFRGVTTNKTTRKNKK